MGDVSPSVVPVTSADGKAAAELGKEAPTAESTTVEEHAATATSDGDALQGLFGGWGMPALPDINKVTENIGNAFNDIVDGADSAFDAAAEKSLGASGAGVERSDDGEGEDRDEAGEEGEGDGEGGEDLQKKAADMAAGATKELEKASKVAQEALGIAAEDLGKGWGKLNHFLDDILAPQSGKGAGSADANAEDLAEDEDVQARFHSLFPDLDESEDVIDHYRCTLLQKYRCYLNNETPEKSLSVRGRLFVSTSHLAMYVFDDGGAFDGAKFHVSVPLAEVARVQKGAKSMMRVITSSQSSYIFAEFESEAHFAGALSLVEHMIESNITGPEDDEAGDEAAAGEDSAAAAGDGSPKGKSEDKARKSASAGGTA